MAAAGAIILVVGLAAGFAAGRTTAPQAASTSGPVISGSAAADQWVPDCGPTPSNECQAETAARQFMAAWRAGGDVSPWAIKDFAKYTPVLRKPPQGDMIRRPSVTADVDGYGSVLLFYPSDGDVRLAMTRENGRWLVVDVPLF